METNVKAEKTVNPDDFRNKMTVSQLMREEGAGLDLFEAKTPGRLRFECGTKAGYVCKNIVDNIDNVQIEDMRYVEIKAEKEGKKVWIPTLFLASTKKRVKHFSLK